MVTYSHLFCILKLEFFFKFDHLISCLIAVKYSLFWKSRNNDWSFPFISFQSKLVPEQLPEMTKVFLVFAFQISPWNHGSCIFSVSIHCSHYCFYCLRFFFGPWEMLQVGSCVLWHDFSCLWQLPCFLVWRCSTITLCISCPALGIQGTLVPFHRGCI